MASRTDGFVYYQDAAAFNDESRFIAVLPNQIGDTDALFDAISDRLQFPSYFGDNWNALSDCLRDLSWIREAEVVLLHPDLPAINRDDLSIYFSVLLECVSSWSAADSHFFIVGFPIAVEEEVRQLLADTM